MPIRRHLAGAGLSHVQNLENNTLHAYHQDEQGSTAYVTGTTGETENLYSYDGFGNILESREDITNRILYTGQQYDQETKQYYLRARYYNPVIGRFTQEDTYRGDGLNLYAYWDNNPVLYYDLSGHDNASNGGCPDGSNKKQEETPSANSKKEFDQKWNDYLDDIEKQTGRTIPENQRNKLLEEINTNPHNEKLTGLDYQQHRQDYYNKKNDMISKWEDNTGQQWPTYTEEKVSKNGNVYVREGGRYDAHEIIPNAYDAPHEWWNIHPAANPNQHQGGIHRSGAPIKQIFK